MLQGLFVAIFVQSLVLAALCFTVRRGDTLNRWLGLYFLTITFQRAFHMLLRNTEWLHTHPWWLCTYDLSVAFGVFSVHCFVLKLTQTSLQPAKKSFVNIAVAVLLFFNYGYFSQFWTDVPTYYRHWLPTAIIASICIYTLIIAADSLSRIRRSLAQPHFENTQLRLTLTAVRWLWYFLTIRSVLMLIFIGIRSSAMKNLDLLSDLEHWYLLLVSTFFIVMLAIVAYFVLRNPAIFDHFLDTKPTVEQQIMLAVLPEHERQIIRPSISSEELASIVLHLRQFMEQEKPWLDPKLTQSKLAERLGLPPYKLGMALNQDMNQHFNEFVNTYRVAQAQLLLTDPTRSRDTMYGVALDSGFASEAPFYAAFKKVVGKSPAAWREEKKSS